jgi:enhancing lycopene biosynthesis protein 2
MRATSIGVILSGCGHLDGSEIQEAVLVLLALSREGAEVQVYAPDVALREVDHRSGSPGGGERRVLAEAARIARGRIKDLATATGTEHDGWIIPGGFGAVKNLSDFASKGASGTVNREVNRVIREAFAARLPVGACCIAPAVLGLIGKASSTKLKLTLGTDRELAQVTTGMGHTHVDAGVTDVVIDAERKVATTPAYMVDGAAIHEVQQGIDAMVRQVVAWSREELSAPRQSPARHGA